MFKHPRILPLLGLAAAMLPLGQSIAATTPETGWPSVTTEMRPWTRWWWMGSAVDAPNLDRELTRYHTAGIGGVEVTPIYGVKGTAQIQYLSAQWVDMLNHAIEEGTKLGMKTDMTTGTGWCFGGPTVNATDANAVIVPSTQTVQPGSQINGTFDPKSTQAIIAYPASGKPVDLTKKIGADGKVDWTADGTGAWQVYAISQKPSGVVVKRAAPGGAGPMLNPFYPDAMTRYMQWFDAPFAASKPKLNSLFQDSYEYNSNWSPDFFAQFEKYRGYRLQDELPALLGNNNDDHTGRVKSDYRQTISDIMTLESMPIWIKWAHDHGYTARYQAHGDPGNWLDLYGIADIPETEMILANRSVLVSKFASSAAHVLGKKYSSSETFTWLSEHFTETMAEMKKMTDDMFLSGVNHIFFHGTAYSPDSAEWPGWCFYASTEMNPRNSVWHDVPALFQYITRSQSILQAGKSDNDILVYFPIFDQWNDTEGLAHSIQIKGDGFIGAPIGVTAQHLWDRGYSFDYVSDRQIVSFQPGHALPDSYRAIYVPPATLMPLDTLKHLQALAAGGVPVIFESSLPTDVPGWGDLANRRAAFKTLLASIQSTPHVSIGDIDKHLADAGVGRESMSDHAGVHYIRRKTASGKIWFIVNDGTDALNDSITLSSPAKAAELMDPMTGRTGAAELTNGSDIHLQLALGESIILRTFKDTGTGGQLATYPAAPAGKPVALTGNWTIKFISGGPTLPAPIQTSTLDSWTKLGGADAQAFGGTAEYDLTFDAPSGASGDCSIALGNVAQSAHLWLNGKDLGTTFIPPFQVRAGALKAKGNVLKVEVTNVDANRIRDMSIRHDTPWKDFEKPGLLNRAYRPFDASTYPLTDSGLLGPVTLIPQSAGS